jgi:ribose 5-phosphate isomerase B
MKISIGSDHAGVDLKNLIINSVKDIDFIDVGTNSTDSCDYPDYILKVASTVKKGEADLGIAICGTGIGASIVANKVKGIRAALCFNEFMAEMSKRHNNANVLVLGARVIGVDLALRIVERWLKSEFEGGRHQRRLDKIAAIEKDFDL